MRHDIEQAQTMLNMLSPTGDGLTFQTFDDNADEPNKALIKQYHGSLKTYAPMLSKLNEQGAGVFITVNSTNGQGRTKSHITAVRALFIDFDSADYERVDRLLIETFPPNLIVESSTNKHHAYWLADDIPLDKFTQWQKRLISYFKSIGDEPDEAVHDLPRVMRLAGFNHCKVSSKKGLTGELFLTKIVHQGQRYSINDIEQFIDSLPAQPTAKLTSKNTHNKELSSPILAYIFDDSQLPKLSAERVRDLARGRWQDILGHLDYHVINDIKEHSQCPICGGNDRFRFDNEKGTGSYICSQGTGEIIAGDGLSLLADHADLGIHEALAAVTAVLNDMGLISAYDDKTISNSKDWAEPKLISQTLPPVKTLTKGMLPDSLQRYVDNNAERLSTPTEYVAIPTVISLASAFGTKVSIFPKFKDDWEIVPNLWGAIIGNPSTKKSPALDAGMKPLRNLTYKAKAEYEQAQKDFAAQKEINKHKAKALDDNLKTMAKKQVAQADDAEDKITDDDLIAKAQAIAEANQSDEYEPILKRYIANDSTYQKLGEMLSQTNNGLLVERDELTELLASLDGESNSEAREFYLVAYNGTGSHIMDRIGRGSVFIPSHCLSIVGGIQPNKLERYLEKTIKGLDNDGMMQRFQLAVYPDHIKGLKEKDIAPDKETRQIVYDLLETIDNMTVGDFLKYGANPPDDYHKRPYYRFTDEAFHTFMNWYDEVKAKADECEHSVIAEHMAKYPKTIASLALIFHLVDCIEHQANLGSVGMTALNAALAWHEMLESHMNRIYSIVTDSANTKASYLADKIINMVKRGADKTDETDWISYGFTARQLIRKGWKGLTDADDVLNALEVLVENNWLSWHEIPSTGQGGRPTERYSINSRLTELI